ncbi:MAG: hypothetical protein ACYTGL_25500 [Planctomycetota bacterium]|jgi:phosphomannomutase
MDAIEPSNIDDDQPTGTDASTGPLIELPAETQYRCPGERHPISRAIHLSRLAAFYPACRQCQHRHDTGQLPPQTIERIQQVERRGSTPSVFRTDGVRGVFLNELTPQLAATIAKAFASVLWQQIPLAGRAQTRHKSQPARRGPSIVVGYDERPSSPALLSAVIDALRMMGCPVTDIGLVSRPCFAFTVAHLQTVGGIFVTGSGCDASSTGMDLVGEGALPLSLGGGLDDVATRLAEGVTRPTRRAGFQQSFQALVPYEASLWKHFHALRPLQVVCAARPRPVRRTLRKLFAKLPCQLSEVESSAAANQPLRHEVLVSRISRRVSAKKAHLGVLIDDDGTRCWFIDERGKVIPSVRVGQMLARFRRIDHPNSAIITESSAASSFRDLTGSPAIDGTDSAESMARAMQGTTAAFGCGTSNRFWWGESFPASDAILTLAHVLQGLSRSDATFSNVIRQKS